MFLDRSHSVFVRPGFRVQTDAGVAGYFQGTSSIEMCIVAALCVYVCVFGLERHRVISSLVSCCAAVPDGAQERFGGWWWGVEQGRM